eukprot:CAMPEP_0172525366 /NCGR_PEP_ID=MMETSP1067-20121228/385_1 /TAXON_ID=265564 ORGANISM="Thalassiosira punctigera, Strain Tpunct2005C2" /NCGR_SAMPLE_ID=MMETSP1067 /ASSEMBLY_ACC=CAM_ASM_000444 /LENGTH=47 /DNA_ID= /DNA_START= /DNA_END= /DNA_ORIENTATION=
MPYVSNDLVELQAISMLEYQLVPRNDAPLPTPRLSGFGARRRKVDSR